MFGGNSNWRGPVWLPLNYLAIRQFVIYHHFFGESFKLEYPTGSGGQSTFGEIAHDLADRIISIWLPGADGRRPLYGGNERLQRDPAWKDNLFFNEYFHGDNGAGLGATHQKGWTESVADLILDPPKRGMSTRRGGAVPAEAAADRQASKLRQSPEPASLSCAARAEARRSRNPSSVVRRIEGSNPS